MWFGFPEGTFGGQDGGAHGEKLSLSRFSGELRMGGAGATRPVEEGADTAVWLATLPDGSPSGQIFRDRKQVPW